MNAPRRQDAFIPFDNSYARLPDRFFARLAPTPVRAPDLIRLNIPLARQLGMDPDRLSAPDGVAVLAGNRVPDGAEPLAMAYAGHQFGGWVPQLGDGRAILLGEVIDNDGVRYDIQLKGSGRTPFSRMGDGRAVLGPVLREYVVSEAMAGLGIPTTRALAAVATGERVQREVAFPGAVLTRVALSHVRVGTFQYFAARQDTDGLRQLADHVIARNYPDLGGHETPYLALLDAVIGRQAELIARWLQVGFIHGVMNTDNMSVAGETIDYGPCAFMDTYHPQTVYSSIDQGGRYAYANQPRIGHWNLACLAQALLPLIDDNEETAIAEAQEVINTYSDRFKSAWIAGFRRKLGLHSAEDGDMDLASDLLERMAANNADFTLTFRTLCDAAQVDGQDDGPVRGQFDDPDAFDQWAVQWRARLAREDTADVDRRAAMRAVNPAFIARNHRVEEAIQAALKDDLGPFETLLSVVSRPFEDQPEMAAYSDPPKPDEVVHQTFCGT